MRKGKSEKRDIKPKSDAKLNEYGDSNTAPSEQEQKLRLKMNKIRECDRVEWSKRACKRKIPATRCDNTDPIAS